MYVELPAVPGTAESRVAALKESRQLLKGEPKTTNPAIFGGGSTEPGTVAGPAELIRLATYIETGHDYIDLHPVGKRRPIVKNIHVTVMAPPSISPEEMEHFMHHVKNGDVADFFEDLLKQAADQPESDDDEKSADGEPEDKRPTFDL